jgi:hypothetical protein
VINQKTGRQYKDHEFSHAAAEVRDAAGLLAISGLQISGGFALTSWRSWGHRTIS